MRNKLILGDAVQVMSNLDSSSIDIVISSPPYKDEDGWSSTLIQDVARESFRLLKEDSLCFINFGHLAGFKMRPFETAQLFINNGFKLNDTIIWLKNHYKPVQGDKRVNNLTEFIFMLYKGEMPSLDRLSIGVPYVDKSNAKRFAGGQDLKCRGNLWEIPYETITSKDQKLHNDRFPLQLPTMCLKLSGLKSGVVLDPFSGSATTLLAAKQLGLNYIGIEKQSCHFITSINRLS